MTATMASTVTPYWAAMTERVSPGATVCRVAGSGVGVAVGGWVVAVGVEVVVGVGVGGSAVGVGVGVPVGAGVRVAVGVSAGWVVRMPAADSWVVGVEGGGEAEPAVVATLGPGISSTQAKKRAATPSMIRLSFKVVSDWNMLFREFTLSSVGVSRSADR